MDSNHYLFSGILKGVEAVARVVDITEPSLSRLPFRWARVNLRPLPGMETKLTDLVRKRSIGSQLIRADSVKLGDGSYQITFVNNPGVSVNEQDYYIELAREYKDKPLDSPASINASRFGVTGQIDLSKISQQRRPPRRTFESRSSYSTWGLGFFRY